MVNVKVSRIKQVIKIQGTQRLKKRKTDKRVYMRCYGLPPAERFIGFYGYVVVVVVVIIIRIAIVCRLSLSHTTLIILFILILILARKAQNKYLSAVFCLLLYDIFHFCCNKK